MCWPYEEVHAGTRGFSPALQVGEGGFGVVYRACLKNVDCAVKRLRQVSRLPLPGPMKTGSVLFGWSAASSESVQLDSSDWPCVCWQDGVMDWTQLRRSFQTEVEKLSK